jgi:hypothetical protein
MFKYLVIFLMIGFVLIGIDANAQCAMCRTTIESTISNGRSNIATGLNTGILYLLTAPYLAVAVIAFLWFRQSKKVQQERISKWQLRQKVAQLLGKSDQSQIGN